MLSGLCLDDQDLIEAIAYRQSELHAEWAAGGLGPDACLRLTGWACQVGMPLQLVLTHAGLLWCWRTRAYATEQCAKTEASEPVCVGVCVCCAGALLCVG